ncbi:MAG: DUF2179 domain-containing protein [Rudaea sp.]
MDLALFDEELVTWVLTPLFICVARVMDVTLGTVRIMFVSRGWKSLAPFLGFFEVLIWLLAIRQIMQNLDNPLSYLGYATGYALGNFVGITLDGRLAVGTLCVQIITLKETDELVRRLRSEGWGVTAIDGTGARGRVKVIITIIPRKDLPRVTDLICAQQPDAFLSVSEVQTAQSGTFPPSEPRRQHLKRFLGIRK